MLKWETWQESREEEGGIVMSSECSPELEMFGNNSLEMFSGKQGILYFNCTAIAASCFSSHFAY